MLSSHWSPHEHFFCVSTWAGWQVERLGYFQSTLQILPPPLVHCQESSALIMGDMTCFNAGGDLVSLPPYRVHTDTPWKIILKSWRLYLWVWLLPCSRWSWQWQHQQTEWVRSCSPETQRHGCRYRGSAETEIFKLLCSDNVGVSGERERNGKVRLGSVPVQRGE